MSLDPSPELRVAIAALDLIKAMQEQRSPDSWLGRAWTRQYASGSDQRGRLMTDLSYFLERGEGFRSRAAFARAVWHGVVRRYECEICLRCGRPVMEHTGSWWHASDALWALVVGHPHGVLCPPCFTELAREHGVTVYWAPSVEPVP